MAARLSEISQWKVLLIESGGTPPPESYIPALNFLLFQGEADWNYLTTSQQGSLLAYENNVSKLYEQLYQIIIVEAVPHEYYTVTCNYFILIYLGLIIL